VTVPPGAGPRPRRNARLFERLLVGLAVAVVSWMVLRLVVNQQAFLDIYFLPIAWASWRLGRRTGVATALASAAIVMGTAYLNVDLFAHPGAPAWMRWTDLVLWAGFLFLTAAAVASLAARDAEHIAQVRTIYTGVLEIMAKLIDSIDRSTNDHSRRVAERSIEVARELGMAETELETLRVGAYLHDIGKVEVSANVLQKAATLSTEERAAMERHVDLGTDMLQRLGGLLESVVPLVLYHHERWDGRGYKGLAGPRIPRGARIIAVCDTYDAIVADRPYRSGQTHDQAVAILRAESGTQFDPEVVAAFLRIYDVPGMASHGNGHELEGVAA
jgi:putative nucleotidyltransferase with HDIG domain